MEREKRRRGKAGGDSRQNALERLKAARAGGTVAEYQLDEIDNVFDEVDEAEYQKIKDERTDAWMVDGDNDYYDDGREIFDDDEEEAANDKEAKKKMKEVKKRNKFAAGTRNITDMFLAQKKKKKSAAAVQINDDNDLEDIFKSIDDDAFSSTLGASKSAKKGTPKLKKKVKKMNMSISSGMSNSSGSSKKTRPDRVAHATLQKAKN